MTRRPPPDFRRHDDWLTHVRCEIPTPEQPYALAVGRLDLFRVFFRMQGLPFPVQFAEEFKRIKTLIDPVRTDALEALNGVIVRALSMHLFNRLQPTTSINEGQTPASPCRQVQELLVHLAQKNPYFALWSGYKSGATDCSVAEEWEDYLAQELGPQRAEEIDFTRSMVELDRLLTLFHDDNLALPRLAFERIWFLHSLGCPERMAQTRAVLGTLVAELGACTSA